MKSLLINVALGAALVGAVSFGASAPAVENDETVRDGQNYQGQNLDQVEMTAPSEPAKVKPDHEFFVGVSLGAVSSSNPNGTSNRDSNFGYGVEGTVIMHHWMFGPNLRFFGLPSDGSQMINVSQSDILGTLEARYRFWDADFSPYLSLGGGGVFQTVTTQVMGNSSSSSGISFVHDFGLGLTGKVAGRFGVNFSTRYYQFSNINGFDYLLSLGIFL